MSSPEKKSFQIVKPPPEINIDLLRTQIASELNSQFQLKLKEIESQYQLQIQKLRSQIPSTTDNINKIVKEKGTHLFKKITIVLYLIETQYEKTCPYCELIKNDGTLDKLKRLHADINLPIIAYDYKEIRCDWADHFLNERYPPYTRQMTPYGMNYFYALGKGFDRFPAFEIWVECTDNKSYYERKLGRGVKVQTDTGTELRVSIYEDIVDYIYSILNGKAKVSISDNNEHKKNVYGNDPLLKNKLT